MTSRTQEDFWRCFDALPAEVQLQARERFRLWQKDAFNAALHFIALTAFVDMDNRADIPRHQPFVRNIRGQHNAIVLFDHSFASRADAVNGAA